jgi:hypothetical protein
MTEHEWLTGTNIDKMPRHAETAVSHPRHRLFGIACCRQYPRYLRSKGARHALSQAEACVAGTIQPGELDRGFWDRGSIAVVEWLVEPDGPTCSKRIVRDLRRREGENVVRRLVPLLREIFPFRHPDPLPQSVLTWNDSTVRRIAEGIDHECAWGNMPILADALLDAGCEDEALMEHCRQPGPHVEGCWALDLVFGKM